MRKLQEVKEELHGSYDDETSSFQAEVTASFNNLRVVDDNGFQRIFINEELVEEEEHSDGPRSLINEDQERRGEQLSQQNVSPQHIIWSSGDQNTSCNALLSSVTPPSGFQIDLIPGSSHGPVQLRNLNFSQ